MSTLRLCHRCSALAVLRKEPPCAACLAAGAKLPEPPWALAHARDRRDCVVCTSALSLPAPEPVAVCAPHKAALERALGLTGDADYDVGASRPKTVGRPLESLWVRSR